MIKVGIIGADSPDAGELLRILIHHPEVVIKCLYAPKLSGRLLSSCHHGFIGEESLNFSDKLNPSEYDIVFIADDSDTGRSLMRRSDEWPNLRIVDMSPHRFDFWESNGMEYGLSEMNRKCLVRGARLAMVPSSVAALALNALYPLASNLLISSDIKIRVEASKAISRKIDKENVAKEISAMLAKTQTSFNSKIEIDVIPDDLVRSMRVRISLKCPLDITEIDRVYNSIYDDHSFTFAGISEVGFREVEGTQKCVVTFCKASQSQLELASIGDSHMRGGAGDAVHIMNLFFSLDEKIGLNMKPSCYGNENESNQQTSWFA